MKQKPIPVDLVLLSQTILKGINPRDKKAVSRKKNEIFQQASMQLHQAGLEGMEYGNELSKLDAIVAKILAKKIANLAAATKVQQYGDATHTGVLVSEKRFGQGKTVWPDGTTEQGLFNHDALNGAGKQSFPDGTHKEGTFVDGVLHGQGKHAQDNGVFWSGQFEDGELTMGVMRFPNGTSKQGTFKDLQLHGVGEWDLGDGRRFLGMFKDGTPDEGIIEHDNGKQERARYDGKKFVVIKARKTKTKGRSFAKRLTYAAIFIVALVSGTQWYFGYFEDFDAIGFLENPMIAARHLVTDPEDLLEQAKAELSNLPEQAVSRSSDIAPPDNSRSTAAVALSIAEASQSVVEDMQNICGPNTASTIIQTTTASTSSGHYAQAAFCCEGEAICQSDPSNLPNLSFDKDKYVVTENNDRLSGPYKLRKRGILANRYVRNGNCLYDPYSMRVVLEVGPQCDDDDDVWTFEIIRDDNQTPIQIAAFQHVWDRIEWRKTQRCGSSYGTEIGEKLTKTYDLDLELISQDREGATKAVESFSLCLNSN
ncbi:MAG: hypothetical protein ACSHYC_16745 [Alphaproteobacteria bacterium]